VLITRARIWQCPRGLQGTRAGNGSLVVASPGGRLTSDQPGNVKLHPELLGKHQAHVKEAIGAEESKPVFFVFHGGSGSSKQEYLDAIGHGVVKVNLDVS